MSRIDSILVPTDGSHRAETGARHGIGLAAEAGAELHAISVVDSPEIAAALSQLNEAEQTEPRQQLEAEARSAVDTVETLARPHLEDVTTGVEWGRPFRTITQYAEGHDIDLIMMGTHGRSGLNRLLLGSVAEKVLRTTSLPVVMVPPAAAVNEIDEISYSELLVPTDGSKAAETAVEWGLTVADIYNGRVHTLYSVDTSWFAGGSQMKVLQDTLEEMGHSALDRVYDRTREGGITVSGTIGYGPAAAVIRSYSEKHDIGLIVMGTHGRAGLRRHLIGSITESVVRTVDVPVCCVPVGGT